MRLRNKGGEFTRERIGQPNPDDNAGRQLQSSCSPQWSELSGMLKVRSTRRARPAN